MQDWSPTNYSYQKTVCVIAEQVVLHGGRNMSSAAAALKTTTKASKKSSAFLSTEQGTHAMLTQLCKLISSSTHRSLGTTQSLVPKLISSSARRSLSMSLTSSNLVPRPHSLMRRMVCWMKLNWASTCLCSGAGSLVREAASQTESPSIFSFFITCNVKVEEPFSDMPPENLSL